MLGLCGMNKMQYPIQFEEKYLSSIHDILEMLKKNKHLEFFRGQSNDEWKLTPRLARMFINHKPSDTWGRLESFMLEDFQKYAIPYIENEPKMETDWLILAQHYGMPTRLLDWTTNPLKALFFAVNEYIGKKSGVLIALQPSGYLRFIDESQTLDSLNQLTPFFPKMIDKRVIAQEGCFTLFPIPENKSNFTPLEDHKFYEGEYYHLLKIYIPKTEKANILEDLNILGINHRTLFPDLDGLSKFIEWKYKNVWVI
jgi:hypothetical protein